MARRRNIEAAAGARWEVHAIMFHIAFIAYFHLARD